jgi:hypothetical protein
MSLRDICGVSIVIHVVREHIPLGGDPKELQQVKYRASLNCPRWAPL